MTLRLRHPELGGISRFLVLRMIVAALVVGAGVMIIQATDEQFPVQALYVLLALIAASGGIVYVATRGGLTVRRGLWMLMVTDILIELAVVHHSGGIGSQFSMIFCLTVMAAAFMLEMPGGLTLATLASCSFVTYAVLEATGIVAPAGREVLASHHRQPGLLDTYMHVSLFFLVGSVGGYLSNRIKLKGRELETATTELAQLRIDTRYILENMSSGIVVVDVDRQVVTMNPAAEEILGVPRKEALERDVIAAFGSAVPELGDELVAALSQERGRVRHEVWVGSDEQNRKPLGTSISLLTDADGTRRGVISVFQDLTEVHEMREQVRKADRLAAVGELSAGIAHELRNPLASISGSIEMLYNELKLKGENGRLMELILRESDRLDRIISDFLDYAKLRQPRCRPVDLDICLQEVLILLRNNLGKSDGVKVNLRCDTDLPRVSMDDEQMRQVFFNLAINSCEAMSESGGNMDMIAEQYGEDKVAILFRDNGPGIQAEDVERLFEPFFTTKEEGTGLGLAIANKIVEAHGGAIEFQNIAGGGAEFKIMLALQPAVVAERQAELVAADS